MHFKTFPALCMVPGRSDGASWYYRVVRSQADWDSPFSDQLRRYKSEMVVYYSLEEMNAAFCTYGADRAFIQGMHDAFLFIGMSDYISFPVSLPSSLQ